MEAEVCDDDFDSLCDFLRASIYGVLVIILALSVIFYIMVGQVVVYGCRAEKAYKRNVGHPFLIKPTAAQDVKFSVAVRMSINNMPFQGASATAID